METLFLLIPICPLGVQQKIVSEQKHIFYVGDTAEDDCRCERCENNELLLTALKNVQASHQMFHFTEMNKVDPIAFVETLICSVENYDCCKGNCETCVGLEKYQELIAHIKTLDEVPYSK